MQRIPDHTGSVHVYATPLSYLLLQVFLEANSVEIDLLVFLFPCCLVSMNETPGINKQMSEICLCEVEHLLLPSSLRAFPSCTAYDELKRLKAPVVSCHFPPRGIPPKLPSRTLTILYTYSQFSSHHCAIIWILIYFFALLKFKVIPYHTYLSVIDENKSQHKGYVATHFCLTRVVDFSFFSQMNSKTTTCLPRSFFSCHVLGSLLCMLYQTQCRKIRIQAHTKRSQSQKYCKSKRWY